MKRSLYSPMSASMICESRAVPSVATTMPCVSPRVNSAEPWVRGSTPMRMVIGRTVRVSRPSMRGSPSRIWLRTIFDSSAKQISFDCVRVRPAFGADADLRIYALPQGIDGLRARLFFLDLERCAQFGFGQRRNARGERFVLGRRLPVPQRLADGVGQFVDRLDHGLHLLVAEHHRTQHHFLRQFLRFRFDHQHGVFGAGDHQIQLGILQLRWRSD